MRCFLVCAAAALIGACRSAPTTRAAPSEPVASAMPVPTVPPAALAASVTPVASAGVPAEASTPPSPSGVVLHWRAFDRKETTDHQGNTHATVALELLVLHGTPARVPLGRRAAFGFSPSVASGPGVIAGVESYVDAHGEYAEVTRPSPGVLQVRAFGQDEALPGYSPPVTNVRSVRIAIPPDAGVEVDEEVEDAAREAREAGAGP